MNDVSSRVADALDAGLIPWRLRSGLPMNVVSRKFYGGVNPILLEIAAESLGRSSPWWGTAQEWGALGSTVVQAPAQGVRLCPNGDPVFNWGQTDRRYERPVLTYDDPALVFDAIILNGGVTIEYGFDATCKYIGAEDKIRMPHRWLFEIGPGGISGYYDSLGHEIFHWTERRLGWDGHPDVSELRAEVGSGYLLGALAIRPLPLHLARHHRNFAPRWSRMLRSQPGLLFRVCDSVTATLDYLLGFASMRVCWCQPDD